MRARVKGGEAVSAAACFVGGFLAILPPAPAGAVEYVRSIEYVEVSLGSGVTSASVNLTKGQDITNCVPFASSTLTDTNARFARVLTDISFQTGPDRVTVQRDSGTGTTSVGVHVVEFDPAFVNVHQGTFANALSAGQPTTSGIPAVALAKAAVVFYYRFDDDTGANEYGHVALAGWFGSTTQLNWQRNDASLGSINGHYYVFEAINNEFAVQALSFSMAASATSASSTLPTPVARDRSFVIASYRTAYADDDSEDGQFRISLPDSSTVLASRSFGGGSGSNLISDIRAFVVELGGNVRVQRGTLTYADLDTVQTASIEYTRPSTAMAWNGMLFGSGAIEHHAFSSGDSDGGFQRLKLTDETTVQGDRGEGTCGDPTNCDGVGSFEIVDFDPLGQMLIRSGSYTGGPPAGRHIFVGFRPDIVIVDRNDPTDPADDEAVIRTATMVGDASKDLDSATPLAGLKIQTLDATGFTIGSDIDVNQSGIVYHWVAFRAAEGQLELGTYSGTGVTQDITSLGLDPAYLLVMSSSAHRPLTKSTPMAANYSISLNALAYTDAILDILPNGFRLGTNAQVNQGGITYHYAVWSASPERVAVGRYIGDGAASQSITGTGFRPEWAVVTRSNDMAGSQANVSVHKPASTGVSTDASQLFDSTLVVTNNIEALQADGFQVGSHARVNSAGAPDNIYYWAAFGPHAPATNYRSIGTAGSYGTGTIDVTNGSANVSGSGTAWQTANRGRGDVITIPCTNPPTCTGGTHYTILGVLGEATLKLTEGYGGATASGVSYLIRRQFATLADWETCIDGNPCGFFPVASSSLVNDDRAEIGIAYEETALARVTISGSTTDATHTITLTADGVNRHYGIVGDGVVVNGAGLAAILVQDEFVTLEWLEITGGTEEGLEFESLSAPNKIVVRNMLVHDVQLQAILLDDPLATADVYNNFVYRTAINTGSADGAISIGVALTTGAIRLFNNTLYDNPGDGIVAAGSNPSVTLINNNSHSNGGVDYDVAGRNASSRNNLASDTTGTTHSPAGGGLDSVPLSGGGGVNLVDDEIISTPEMDLHLQGSSVAIEQGADNGALFVIDIDSEIRPGGPSWDIGADEFGVTTAVELVSFEALPSDSAVDLAWRTGSELDNLGFHLYRSLSKTGPWTRVTPSLIPGLGSSPEGASYSFRDAGLLNGTTYFYRLEDIDATSGSTFHGPISATPSASAPEDDEGSPETEGAGSDDDPDASDEPTVDGPSGKQSTYGAVGEPSFRVVSRTGRSVVVELTTPGFVATSTPAGVRVSVPGFDSRRQRRAPALPLKRALLDGVLGRHARIVWAKERKVLSFPDLTPAAVGAAEVFVRPDGTVRPRRRQVSLKNARNSLLPRSAARIAGDAFIGEAKKLALEMSPIRYDTASGELLLARTLRVKIAFDRKARTEETGRGSRGRRRPRSAPKERHRRPGPSALLEHRPPRRLLRGSVSLGADPPGLAPPEPPGGARPLPRRAPLFGLRAREPPPLPRRLPGLGVIHGLLLRDHLRPGEGHRWGPDGEDLHTLEGAPEGLLGSSGRGSLRDQPLLPARPPRRPRHLALGLPGGRDEQELRILRRGSRSGVVSKGPDPGGLSGGLRGRDRERAPPERLLERDALGGDLLRRQAPPRLLYELCCFSPSGR